jgi:hypothetical protein
MTVILRWVDLVFTLHGFLFIHSSCSTWIREREYKHSIEPSWLKVAHTGEVISISFLRMQRAKGGHMSDGLT